MPSQNIPQAQKWSAKKPLSIGFFALGALVLGVGVWSYTTQIAGAVIVSGMIQVESNQQVIQHPVGGVVGKINAKNGDTVQAGDIVLQFDDTQLKSELAVIEGQYFEFLARSGRFEAERDGKDEIKFADKLLDEAKNNADLEAQIEGQRNLFLARIETIDSQKAQLNKQKTQIEGQILGAEAQAKATQTQIELLNDEINDTQSLLDKGLAQASRVLALRREKAQLEGTLGNLVAQTGKLQGDISNIDLRIVQLAATRREEAISELRDLRYRIIELEERLGSTKQTLSRLDVRAPMDGIIHNSQVFALQAVVQPAEPMMYVIPSDLPLVVSAQVDTVHIDQVFIGQDASLRFSSFNQRSTPEIFGKVTNLSADIFTDQNTGFSYYQIELIPNAEEMDKLGGLELLPGMPVEAFIKTDERSALTYFVKPVADYFNKAFREE